MARFIDRAWFVLTDRINQSLLPWSKFTSSPCQLGLQYARLYLQQRVKTPLRKECPRYVTKLHLVARLKLWRSKMWSISSLILLQGPLWSGEVKPITVPCMSQIDLFKNCSYSIGQCAKNRIIIKIDINKTLQKRHKKCRYECTMNAIL